AQLRFDMTYRTAVVLRALVAALVFPLVASCAGQTRHVADTRLPTAAGASPPAQVEALFPIPVIDLCGNGADIGREHAEALGEGIRTLHGRYIASFFPNAAAKFVALAAASLFEPKIAPEHLAEVKALASYTSIDPRQMLLAQCFLDLSPMAACSTVT